MATYLQLVNKVAARAGWDNTTSSGFATVERPHDVIKDLINEAKDEVVADLGIRSSEEEFAFNTIAPRGSAEGEGAISGTAGSTAVAGSVAPDEVTVFAASDVGLKLISAGFDGWFRITARGGVAAITVDASFRSTFSAQTYELVEDEYDLDPRVRKIHSAWTDRGPLALVFVSEPFYMDRYYPAYTDLGTPRELAVYRSSTTAQIWQVQLRPIPDDNYIIRLKADTRFADLSAADDFWEIMPETEHLIVDRALYKALNSPLLNDPDLGLALRADIADRTRKQRERIQEPTPQRRLRRFAPDEVPSLGRLRNDPTRFH